jgi:hypothetical protein
LKRAFAIFAAAALTAGIAPSVDAAASGKPAPTKPAPKDACASKPSKFQQQQCREFTHSAPGDEYFGRMKMSYLGINNTFRDETIRSGSFTTSPGVITTLNFADQALHAWANKYPGDPELARSYFLAIGAYSKVYTQPAQDKAWQYMHILATQFPQSYFGKQVEKNLAVGFTERYFTDPVPCATPTDAPTPDVLPNGKLAPTPLPTDTPSPTPEPTASPTPAPGQPKVLIFTPPCVAATPEPTLEPAAPTPNATPVTGPAITPAPLPASTAEPSAQPPVAQPTPTPVPLPAQSSTPLPAASPSP